MNGTPLRTTSTMAILSLVFGILSWVALPFLGAVVAIVTGHLARGEVRTQPERYDGDGLAIAGLVLGYGQLVITLLVVLGVVLFFGGIAAFLALAGIAHTGL